MTRIYPPYVPPPQTIPTPARPGPIQEEAALLAELGIEDPRPLYYGGAPALDVGDPILPRLGLPPIPLPAQTAVCLWNSVLSARDRAAEWHGGGDLYLAEPLGEQLRGPDFRYRAARVVGVLRRGIRWKDVRDDACPLPEPPFFHGGVPGLEVGDHVLPVLWHEAVRRPADPMVQRTDEVFMSTSVEVAWGYAFRRAGDLYQVVPQGAARVLEGGGILAAEAAQVVAVIARDVDREVSTTNDPRPPELRGGDTGH